MCRLIALVAVPSRCQEAQPTTVGELDLHDQMIMAVLCQMKLKGVFDLSLVRVSRGIIWM